MMTLLTYSLCFVVRVDDEEPYQVTGHTGRTWYGQPLLCCSYPAVIHPCILSFTFTFTFWL